MLWIKAFHVLAVVGWMTGVFYTPRVLVNYAEAERLGEPLDRLRDMAKRLYRFSSIIGVIALTLGLILWLGYGIAGLWLQAKLFLVTLLILHHFICGIIVGKIQSSPLRVSPVLLRAFNEIPVIIVAGILVLVVVKPF